MKRYIGLFMAAILMLGVVGCGKEDDKTATDPDNTQPLEKTTALQLQAPTEGEEIAVITSSMGEIKLRFFPSEAPKAVENFITHAKEGYYDGLTFHRVIEEFMIQTGDPTGTGGGGESIWGEEFEDEISPNLHFFKGALAMANRGANTNGSQFFIVHCNVSDQGYLDKIIETRENSPDLGISINDVRYSFTDIFSDEVMDYYAEHGGTPRLEFVFGDIYTVFGQVIEGLDVVDAIAAVEVGTNDKPTEDVLIEKITFEEYKAQ